MADHALAIDTATAADDEMWASEHLLADLVRQLFEDPEFNDRHLDAKVVLAAAVASGRLGATPVPYDVLEVLEQAGERLVIRPVNVRTPAILSLDGESKAATERFLRRLLASVVRAKVIKEPHLAHEQTPLEELASSEQVFTDVFRIAPSQSIFGHPEVVGAADPVAGASKTLENMNTAMGAVELTTGERAKANHALATLKEVLENAKAEDGSVAELTARALRDAEDAFAGVGFSGPGTRQPVMVHAARVMEIAGHSPEPGPSVSDRDGARIDRVRKSENRRKGA